MNQMLLGMLADIETFVDLRWAKLDSPPPRVALMLADGVPYDPAHWLGRRLAPADRMVCSRAHRRLAGDGMVVAVYESSRDRVKCLRPTLAGLRLALGLAGRTTDRATVVAGLRRTMWGSPLADSLAAKRTREGHSLRERRCSR